MSLVGSLRGVQANPEPCNSNSNSMRPLLLQEAFSELDKDGDGHLTPDELHAALRNTGALAKAGLAADIDPHVLEVRLNCSWR